MESNHTHGGPGGLQPGGRRRAERVRELLLAGIAVLGAAWLLVIGPFLSRARESSTYGRRCMANLHQLGVALRMYGQDWHGYPPDLRERAIPPGENWYGPDAIKTRPGYGLATLFPDYVSNVRVFRCPWNATDTLGTGGRGLSYQSYDGEDPAAGPGGSMAAPNGRLYSDTSAFAPGIRLRYARVWKTRRRDGRVEPDPVERRQLIWPDASPDTVVTWCSHHRRHPSAASLEWDDWDLLVTLDGAVRRVRSMTRSGHAAPAPPS